MIRGFDPLQVHYFRLLANSIYDMRNLKNFSEFNLFESADRFDSRVAQLEAKGFTHTRTGLTNGIFSFLYSQIEEPDESEWQDFLNVVDERNEQTEQAG